MAILATGITKVSGKVADTGGEVVLTAADVGAVNKAGDIMTGALIMRGSQQNIKFQCTSHNGGDLIWERDNAGVMEQQARLWSSSPTKLHLGAGSGTSESSAGVLTINASNEMFVGGHRVFTAANKPSANDVGAEPAGAVAAAVSGLASRVNLLETLRRTIALTGDVTGQADFDGSGNISITATYKNSGVTAGTYRSVTVDAKGNITAGSNPTTLGGYGITDAVSSTQYATEALKGIASVATQAEVNAGTEDTKFVTAKKLLAWVKQASETVLGMMKVATQSQTDVGVADDVAVTPKKLRAGFAISLATNGYVALPSWMGGLIIQWGSITPAGGNGTAPLPITFVTDSFCIVGQLGTGGIAEFGLVNIYTEGLSTVRAITRNYAGGLMPLQVRYIAIGK